MKTNIEQLLESIQYELTCPILREMMKDPVTTTDGHTYERYAIAKWLKMQRKSPKTNLPLSTSELIPNIALRNIIARLTQEKELLCKKFTFRKKYSFPQIIPLYDRMLQKKDKLLQKKDAEMSKLKDQVSLLEKVINELLQAQQNRNKLEKLKSATISQKMVSSNQIIELKKAFKQFQDKQLLNTSIQRFSHELSRHKFQISKFLSDQSMILEQKVDKISISTGINVQLEESIQDQIRHLRSQVQQVERGQVYQFDQKIRSRNYICERQGNYSQGKSRELVNTKQINSTERRQFFQKFRIKVCTACQNNFSVLFYDKFCVNCFKKQK